MFALINKEQLIISVRLLKFYIRKKKKKKKTIESRTLIAIIVFMRKRTMYVCMYVHTYVRLCVYVRACMCILVDFS